LKIFYSDTFDFPLHDGQDFLISKYKQLIDKIIATGLAQPEELLIPPGASNAQITRVHTPDYVDHLLKGTLSPREIREVGLPWSAQIIERARVTAGATIETCRWSLTDGVALHLGGGTHHAFADRAKGFCWLNDCAIAAKAMIAEGLVKKVLILDCDVHQGDGTAAIFRNDPDIFTFSIHASSTYPYHKEASDLDIELPVDTLDQNYLRALEKGIKSVLQNFKPDLVIYLAGADIFEDDRYGCLALSHQGIGLRDQLVLNCFAATKTPIAVTLAGGYAKDIQETVQIHFQTVKHVFECHQGMKNPDPAENSIN
jgi:acetoin utilization deacetylase AcuC-like enzyme